MTVRYEEHFFNSQDGLRLFYRQWSVPRSRGLVAVVHGLAEHSGRYQELARALNDGGWAVAAVDYRGHGQAGGKRAHIDHFSDYLNDIRAFLGEIRRQGYNGKPVLLGHGQGGLICARLAEIEGERLGGLVLSSPFFGMAAKLTPVKMVAANLFSRMLPSLTLSIKNSFDHNYLSHDRNVVERYVSDPLVGSVATVGWFAGILSAQQVALTEAGWVPGPLLVLQAGDDRLSSLYATRSFFESASTQNKQLKIYDRYYHDVFNEVGRERVIADLTNWLEINCVQRLQ